MSHSSCGADNRPAGELLHCVGNYLSLAEFFSDGTINFAVAWP